MDRDVANRRDKCEPKSTKSKKQSGDPERGLVGCVQFHGPLLCLVASFLSMFGDEFEDFRATPEPFFCAVDKELRELLVQLSLALRATRQRQQYL